MDPEPDISENFLINVEDSLLSQFTREDDSVLDYLVVSGEEGPYCHDLLTQVRELLTIIKVGLRKSKSIIVVSNIYPKNNPSKLPSIKPCFIS